MSDFKPLDPAKILELLQGHENILQPLIEKEQDRFRNTACPSCGHYSHEQLINAKRPFSPGSALPNRILRCMGCASEFDPYSGLIHKTITLEED